jgi:DNA adenine methylase
MPSDRPGKDDIMQSFIGWIGGKRALRSQILQQFPSDIGRYIEVFGGAGWVLFGRMPEPGQLEVFNDADGSFINVYRCIKYHCTALQQELDLLPDSRELFGDFTAQENVRGLTDIQRAARSLYVIKFSFGSDRDSFATAQKSICNLCNYLPQISKRLHGVVIEHLDFARLIHIYDRPDALFYCDPPYVGTESYYRTRFSKEDHKRLSQALHCIKGRFILSYNDCKMVRTLYADCKITTTTRKVTLPANTPKDYSEVIIRNF